MTIGIIESVWNDVDLCCEFKDSVFRTSKCSLRRWKEEGEEEGKERGRERGKEERERMEKKGESQVNTQVISE